MTDRKRVLVVDDDPGILALLERRLGAVYRVETVLNGSQAIGACLREPPDAIVLDMRLPGMNGEQLLPALRAVAASAPIVVITGAATAQMKATARAHGVQHLLEKPFDAQDLTARLAALLGG